MPWCCNLVQELVIKSNCWRWCLCCHYLDLWTCANIRDGHEARQRISCRSSWDGHLVRRQIASQNYSDYLSRTWLRTSGNEIIHADLFPLAKLRHSGLVRKHDTIKTKNKLVAHLSDCMKARLPSMLDLFWNIQEDDVAASWAASSMCPSSHLNSNFQIFAWVISRSRIFESFLLSIRLYLNVHLN